MTKKILITGGAGFVGRRLVKFMLEKNYDVVAVDNILSFDKILPLNQGIDKIIRKSYIRNGNK